MNTKINTHFLAILALICFVPMVSVADIDRTKGKEQDEEILRTPSGVYDNQLNKVSRISFYNSNYGIFGYNIAQGVGGGIWPRGTTNQYIFAGGIWLATQKRTNPQDSLKKLCLISYNPNSGRSWMVPGRISDGDNVQNSQILKYRVYFSTDFNPVTGVPLNPQDGPNWPLWDTKDSERLKERRYFGYYIQNENDRSPEDYPKGPAFISQEDIFSTFKDTDMSRYEGGATLRKREGYPLRVQTEQTIYSWGFGDFKDFIFIKYNMINTSSDTLYNTWIAPVFDVDIALTSNSQIGARNDNARFVNEKENFNLAVQWSLGTAGEAGRGFGYLGFDFLESPAVYPYVKTIVVGKKAPPKQDEDSLVQILIGATKDSIGRIRKDKRVFSNSEQLGLRTFKNWPIENDPLTNENRYDFIGKGEKDGQGEVGDKRFMMASGPFTMEPGDTARTVVGLVLAKTSKGGDADGTFEDLRDLIRIDSFAQTVYDNNFKAPKPPDPANIRFRGLNNAIKVQWDSTSELSYDDLERGLDFKGYTLYRARRDDLDTFDLDVRPNVRRGPFGWKQVARWVLPSPFAKSRISPNYDKTLAPFDSFRVVKQINQNTYHVRRFPTGSSLLSPFGTPPWNKLFSTYSDDDYAKYFDGIIKVEDAFKDKAPQWSATLNREIVPDSSNSSAWPKVKKRDIIYDMVSNRLPATGLALFRKTTASRYNRMVDTLFQLLNKGYASISFAQIDSGIVNNAKIAKEYILPYMDSITNHRTFIDVGDDNQDGSITSSTKVEATEKIFNNVDYYYRLLSDDEGDFKQSTNAKQNSGVNEQNQIKALALAGGFAKEPNSRFDIEFLDNTRLGGLSNFQFHVLDESRFNKLFMNEKEGHTLRLAFVNRPFFVRQNVDEDPSKDTPNQTPNLVDIGVYTLGFQLTDLTTNQLLFEGSTSYEDRLCNPDLNSFFTENAALIRDSADNSASTNALRAYPYKDVNGNLITISAPDGKGILTRTGNVTTQPFEFNSCYSSEMRNNAQQTLAFSFDWNLSQYGGVIRPDSAYISKSNGNVDTRVVASSAFAKQISQDLQPIEVVLTSTGVAQRIEFGSGFRQYNYGPGTFELEFLPGDVEKKSITIGSSTNQTTYEVDVPYLNVRLKNITSFNRQNRDGSVTNFRYPETMPHVDLPIVDGELNDNQMPILSFNIASFGWSNVNTNFSLATRRSTSAGLIGQGRYYLPVTNMPTGAKDSMIYFVNQISVYGAKFYLDMSGRNHLTSSSGEVFTAPSIGKTSSQRVDFQPGDKVVLSMYGGTLGLPVDSAYILVKVRPNIPAENEITDDMLKNSVRVVPNPYYVTNQSQKSSYDNKVFFTNLPKKCTIKIYTTSGELVNTIEHDEVTAFEPDRESMDIYDLSNKSGRRVASQSLIALIETPNGAKTSIPFSIVVGSFRLID